MRAWLAAHAELLAAYRLPGGIFAENGGSQAGADVLILRKYHQGETSHQADWLDLAPLALPAGGSSFHATTGARYGDEADTLAINTYFVHHPAQVIGSAHEIRRNGALYYVVAPPHAADITSVLAQQLAATLPLGVVHKAPPPMLVTASGAQRDLLVDTGAPNLEAVALPQRARAAALTEVYQAAKALIRRELQDTDSLELEQARRAMNSAYDAFIGVYGIISASSNRQLFKHLPELAFLQALEERAHRP